MLSINLTPSTFTAMAKRVLSFISLNSQKNYSRNDYNFRKNSTYNLSKKYDYFGNYSLHNENNFFKSFQ